jgi:hypothetical protein
MSPWQLWGTFRGPRPPQLGDFDRQAWIVYAVVAAIARREQPETGKQQGQPERHKGEKRFGRSLSALLD